MCLVDSYHDIFLDAVIQKLIFWRLKKCWDIGLMQGMECIGEGDVQPLPDQIQLSKTFPFWSALCYSAISRNAKSRYLQFWLWIVDCPACMVVVHLLNGGGMTRRIGRSKGGTSLDQSISQLYPPTGPPPKPRKHFLGLWLAFVCSCFCSQVKRISRKENVEFCKNPES